MITVIAGHYRLPEYRFRQFMDWNREGFEAFDVRAIIVSDVPRDDLPPWARIVLYPGELEVYSPSKVSNYGIRQAGAGIVCKTDIDCVFSRGALEEIAGVRKGFGVSLAYFMAKSYEARQKAIRWESTKGTLALVFEDWDLINGYDERQEGYGLEDGDGYCRAMRIAKVRRPQVPFWHIAHDAEQAQCPQANQNRRVDQWNRDNGFCPLRHRENRAARRSGPWRSDSWGLPDPVRLVADQDGPGDRDRPPPLDPVPGTPQGRAESPRGHFDGVAVV